MLEPFLEFIPTPLEALFGAGIALLSLLVAVNITGRLHFAGFRVGDTRKLFHFFIFNTAAIVRCFMNQGAVVSFGLVVSGGVLWATFRGSSSLLYRSLARPADAPHQTLHILIPLGSTIAGGIVAHFLCGPASIVPYLIGGWGDAVGEPIGIRWGKHRYRVLTIGGIISERSWEGSAAVFSGSAIAAFLGLAIMTSGFTQISILSVAALVAFLAMTATLVEAASPHGLDNFTILVSTALVMRMGLPE